jgi:small GTP-binding protein
MQNLEEKLRELRDEYSKTKYNKATNKYLGRLRKKIALVKKEMSEHKKAAGTGFSVKKTGDATVALVGFPNAGKSSLLGQITNAESKVADYAFTTLSVIPGVMEYNGAKIQIFDVPGLIEGASQGKGRGTEVASAIRVCDLIAFVVDINSPGQLYKLLDELHSLGIMVNVRKPRIRIEKRPAGGLNVEAGKYKVPDKNSIAEVLREFKIFNANLIFGSDASLEDIADLLDDSTAYIDGMVILNKIDTVDKRYSEAMKAEIEALTGMDTVLISASNSVNLEQLRRSMFGHLKLIRIYLKPKDGPPDFSKPLIVGSGSTVYDVARGLHSKIAKNLKYAVVTGKSARFKNQKEGRDHPLADGDVVTLVYDKA